MHMTNVKPSYIILCGSFGNGIDEIIHRASFSSARTNQRLLRELFIVKRED